MITSSTQPPRRPDAGSRAWAIRTGWAAFVLVVVVAVLQRWPERPPPPPPPGSPAFVAAEPHVDLTGRFVLKAAQAMRSLAPGQSVAALTANMDSLARASRRPDDHIRSAIVAAELWRSDPAEARRQADQRLELARRLLDSIPRPEDREPLRRDIEILQALYASPEAVGQAERQTLLDRYGYFGRVALAFHLPDHDAERAALFSRGELLLLVAFAFVAAVAIAAIVGLVLLILALVTALRGGLRPAFQPPAPGGSAHLEAFLLFLLGFVALALLGSVVASIFKNVRWLPAAILLVNWALALVPLWVVARGTPRAEALRQMGLHPGRGVAREIAAGLAAYLAGLPLVLASIVAALLLVALVNAILGTPDAQPENPVFERLARGDAAFLAALFFMATVWAPIVEETIFRGCLYRHLAARWPFPVAAAISAVAFGVVHGVPLPLTLPLMTLGFVFACMRHWRDSLIAPMTAHALHNATVLAFALSLLHLLRA